MQHLFTPSYTIWGPYLSYCFRSVFSLTPLTILLLNNLHTVEDVPVLLQFLLSADS